MWQEGQQTGVSVLAAHPPLAFAAEHPARIHPQTITCYNRKKDGRGQWAERTLQGCWKESERETLNVKVGY